MKWLAILAAGLLFLVVFTATGCIEDAVSPTPGVEMPSSCVTCHTDEDTLKKLAVEEEEGEGGGEG